MCVFLKTPNLYCGSSMLAERFYSPLVKMIAQETRTGCSLHFTGGNLNQEEMITTVARSGPSGLNFQGCFPC